MNKLCQIQGCGVCLDCKQNPKQGVYCRKNVVEIIENQKEVIEDLANFIIDNCKDMPKTREGLYEWAEYYTRAYVK